MAGRRRTRQPPAPPATVTVADDAPIDESAVAEALATIDESLQWDDERPAPPRRQPALRRRVWRMTLLLALGLSVAAAAAGGVDRVLHWSLRTPTAADGASAACALLLNGNYDRLADEMDPAPDGASTDPFDRDAFEAGLRALDASDGRVTSCTLRQMGPAADTPVAIFALTTHRAHRSDPLDSLVVVRREPDGRWLLSRASTFYYALG